MVFQPLPSPQAAQPLHDVVVCEQCDLLHQVDTQAAEHLTTYCRRCGAVLTKPAKRTVDTALALALTSLFTLCVAHLHPILGIVVQGQRQQASLWQAAEVLRQEGAELISLLVLLTTLIAPLLEAAIAIWVLLPLRSGYIAPGALAMLRVIQHLRPWVMVEVFMLGVLVATVKLSSLATIEPGIGLWAFSVSMFVIAALGYSFDAQAVLQDITARSR